METSALLFGILIGIAARDLWKLAITKK